MQTPSAVCDRPRDLDRPLFLPEQVHCVFAMRSLSKFHVLSALAACSILYSAWVLTSRRYQLIAPVGSGRNFQVASDFDKRLVVFGDSWSDDKVKGARVRVWTDWLCSMVRVCCRERDIFTELQLTQDACSSTATRRIWRKQPNHLNKSTGALLWTIQNWKN